MLPSLLASSFFERDDRLLQFEFRDDAVAIGVERGEYGVRSSSCRGRRRVGSIREWIGRHVGGLCRARFRRLAFERGIVRELSGRRSGE